jgi:transcriptional regulator with XRE-family HTH domain
MKADNDYLEKFGRRIKELRNTRQLSQEKLAALCNLDRTYISGVERGKRNISLLNIKLISEALKISLYELFKELD